MTEDFQRRFDKRMPDADVVANALRQPENLATAKAALGKFLDAAIDTAEPLMMQYIAFQDMNMVRLNGDWDRYRDARRLFRKFNPTLPSLMGKRPVSKPKLKRSAAHKAAMQDGADTYEHYIRMGKEHMCELDRASAIYQVGQPFARDSNGATKHKVGKPFAGDSRGAVKHETRREQAPATKTPPCHTQ
ncbi:hypothetical protein MBLNU230_g1908t2 [Neophaeotheca triangularis]